MWVAPKDSAKGVPPETVDKLRKIFAYLDNLEDPEELRRPPALSSLLNGKANLSGDMALRIEKAFGVKMDTLMKMQSAYDIAQTRKREKEIRIRRIRRIHRAADIRP